MTSAAPQPERRSSLGIALVAGLVVSALIVGVLAFMSRGGDGVDTTAEPTGIVKELKDAGYKKVKGEKLPHEGLKRDVATEWWERTEEPQQVVISDESPYTTEGVLVVNAVNYRGTDGKGNLSCQPDPEHTRSNIKAIIEDANKVRAGIADGNLKPVENQGGGFPYRGDFMGCMP
jgi:hypothetical protein